MGFPLPLAYLIIILKTFFDFLISEEVLHYYNLVPHVIFRNRNEDDLQFLDKFVQGVGLNALPV
jgi:hypothetical protein